MNKLISFLHNQNIISANEVQKLFKIKDITSIFKTLSKKFLGFLVTFSILFWGLLVWTWQQIVALWYWIIRKEVNLLK